MLIRELSCRTGASIRSIRHYELKGLVHARRLANGYRDYDEQAVERVRLVQLYLSLGLTTDNIAKVIDCPVSQETNRPLCQEAYQLYKAKLDEINKQIDLLLIIQLRLQERMAAFEQV